MPEPAVLQAERRIEERAMIRKARLTDVNALFRLINHYADRQRMLPKTQLQLYENLRDYSVAMEASTPERLLGCGALHIYWENLAEIRSLAVEPESTQQGVGSQLVELLLNEARELQIEQVFAFTYEPEFFSRLGFMRVKHHTLPLKVYNECFHCSKFNQCDELAMVLYL
jgi:amino-acid N-acetyltransferase